MNSRSFIFALVAAFIWGLAPAFEKIGLAGKIDPYLGVVVRTIPIALAGMFGLMLMGRTGELLTIDSRSAFFVIIGGLLAGFFGQIAFYMALKNAEASTVVPLAAIYPLIALFVSVFFLGEAFTITKLIGITLVIASA
ncbi:MAG: EamA family transporter [Deltaproteobacteria bacterium]|nr:EamA family transporter [Deltaproteobacteria bacterium]